MFISKVMLLTIIIISCSINIDSIKVLSFSINIDNIIVLSFSINIDSIIVLSSIMASNTSVSLNYSRVIILCCSLVLVLYISYHTVLHNSTVNKLLYTGDDWTRVSIGVKFFMQTDINLCGEI